MSDSQPPEAPNPLTFVIVFLASPILMSLAATVTVFREWLGHPLTIALALGHVVTVSALVFAYLRFKRGPKGE